MTNAKIVTSSVKVGMLLEINMKTYLLKFDEALSIFIKILRGH